MSALVQQKSRAIDLSGTPPMLPDYLVNMPTIVGRVTVGTARNRLGLKGREFHVFRGGVEEGTLDTKYADVVIVGAIPHVSRIYYRGNYMDGEAKAPSCYSVDGIRPASDVKSPQCGTCMACPQNVVGSGTTAGSDGKTRACGYFRRLAVVFPGDPTVYQLDVKAQGLFDKKGDLANNRYSFNEYAKKLASANNGAGIDLGYVITRLSFDPAVSVPKLFFQPIDYIAQDEVAMVVDLIESGAVKQALELTMTTVDLSSEAPAAAQASEPPKPVVAASAEENEPEAPSAVDKPTLRPAIRPTQRQATAEAPPQARPAPVQGPSAAAASAQAEIDALLAELE